MVTFASEYRIFIYIFYKYLSISVQVQRNSAIFNINSTKVALICQHILEFILHIFLRNYKQTIN